MRRYLRQDSLIGYAQPFYIRMSSPGWFESSMAVVSSINIEKGGPDNLWTVDNLPQEISLTLNIQEMYTSLVAIKKYNYLSYNLGLASYLDCLAGLRIDELNVTKRLSSYWKTRLSYVRNSLTNRPNRIGDFLYDIKNTVINSWLR